MVGALCLAGLRTLCDGQETRDEKQMARVRAVCFCLVYGKAGGRVRRVRQKDEAPRIIYDDFPDFNGSRMCGDDNGGNSLIYQIRHGRV